MPTGEAAPIVAGESRLIGRIPVRNIWLLFLYASNLARFHGQHTAAVEESPDFPSLVARLLCYAVDRRLRRNLSRGYQSRRAVLTRVRGRIDILQTFSGDLLSKGMIACRFEEFTFDTPRNRLVRAALHALSNRIDDAVLSHACARLAGDLGRQGVSGLTPSRSEMSADRMGRHDADDLLMVTLAKLVFDLVLPTEDEGGLAMTRVEKDAALVRQLFEKAIGNFYATELPELGWVILQGKRLAWQIEDATAGIAAILPGMTSDIILDHSAQDRMRCRGVVSDAAQESLSAESFGISDTEAAHMDPGGQRIVPETSREAVLDAGPTLDGLRGVQAGATSGGVGSCEGGSGLLAVLAQTQVPKELYATRVRSVLAGYAARGAQKPGAQNGHAAVRPSGDRGVCSVVRRRGPAGAANGLSGSRRDAFVSSTQAQRDPRCAALHSLGAAERHLLDAKSIQHSAGLAGGPPSIQVLSGAGGACVRCV